MDNLYGPDGTAKKATGVENGSWMRRRLAGRPLLVEAQRPRPSRADIGMLDGKSSNQGVAMKKLIILAVLATTGFGVYKVAFASSAAYKAYEKFADAMLHDRWDDARKLTTGDAVKGVIDQDESFPKKVGYEIYRNLRGVVHMGPSRRIESEAASPDGKSVTLRVLQEERRGPVTMSPIGRPTVRHKQDVIVVQTPDGWRVQGFKEEVESLADR